MMKTALTIAGSDSSGGAGIQADLKTFSAFGVYGCSVLTAITAQNTTGVQAVEVLKVDFVEKQILSVIEDISINAVKTGMLAEPEIVTLIATLSKQGRLRNLVVDPVMISKSGHSLLSPQAVNAVKEKLIPAAYLVTPNLHEAAAITGLKVTNLKEMKIAAKKIVEMGAKNVILKGGHLEDTEATDILYDGASFEYFSSRRTDTKHTHGTGCTFSAAIAAGLAQGHSLSKALSKAKDFISSAISHSPGIGHGSGPVNHLVEQTSKWA